MRLDPASKPAPAPNLIARLDAARSVIETKFLAAGEIISTTIEGVGALIASLDRMAEALNPQTVQATTRDLKTAACRLQGLPPVHAERLAALDALENCRAGLDAHVFDMRRGLAYMRAFTISIKVTAAGIAAASQEFAVFADDIQAGLARGGVELGELEVALRALESGTGTARTQGAALSNRLAESFPSTPEDLLANADLLSEHQKRIVETTERAAVLARDIRKRISRALAALQIGDITRQRIEHVQTALKSLEVDETLRGSDCDAAAGALMRGLLARQLTAAAEDFHRDVSEISRSMSHMESTAAELMHLQELAHGRGEGDKGYLRDLESRLEHAHALVREMEVADRAASEAGMTTVIASRQIMVRVEAIQSIKTDVQYMALNTTLKCTHIGDAGRPLRVIALELREHGARLDTSAADTLTALGELDRVAGRLAGEGPSADGPSEAAAAGEALRIAADRIHVAGDLAQVELVQIAKQGRATLDLLAQSTTRLGFEEEIGGILCETAQRLSAPGALASMRDADESGALGALLAGLAASYTMAQEREVHQAFLDEVQWEQGQDALTAAA